MLIAIGYGSFVQKEIVILILPPHSSFAKRLIRKAREEGRLSDVTAGRRTRSAIVAVRDCQFFVILSAFQPETLKWRLNQKHTKKGEERDVFSYGGAHDETSVAEPPVMIPIGYDSFVQKETVVLILPPNSSFAKRLIKKAEADGTLFDVTAGRKTRGVIVAARDNSFFIILTAFQPETLKWRVNQKHTRTGKEEEVLSYGGAHGETSAREAPMMIPVGYDSFIQRETVVLILPPTSSSAKRLVRKAEEEGRLFDTTAGRKTRGVIAVVKHNCRLIILSAFQPETLKWRFNQKHTRTGKEEEVFSYSVGHGET